LRATSPKLGHHVSIANSMTGKLDRAVIWATPGGSSPERRLTAEILKPLLGARSPKPTGAG
jgi:hypothetical protein